MSPLRARPPIWMGLPAAFLQSRSISRLIRSPSAAQSRSRSPNIVWTPGALFASSTRPSAHPPRLHPGAASAQVRGLRPSSSAARAGKSLLLHTRQDHGHDLVQKNVPQRRTFGCALIAALFRLHRMPAAKPTFKNRTCSSHSAICSAINCGVRTIKIWASNLPSLPKLSDDHLDCRSPACSERIVHEAHAISGSQGPRLNEFGLWEHCRSIRPRRHKGLPRAHRLTVTVVTNGANYVVGLPPNPGPAARPTPCVPKSRSSCKHDSKCHC